MTDRTLTAYVNVVDMVLRLFFWVLIVCVFARTSAGRLPGRFSVFESQSRKLHNEYLEYESTITDGDVSGAPGMEASLSAYGLNYAKEVVVHEILDEMTPLAISDIFLTETSYYFGSVEVELTEIVLANLTMLNAEIALDEDIITVFAEQVEANMTLKWHYAYAGLVGDKGNASVQVHD